jgi:hypothetical protein
MPLVQPLKPAVTFVDDRKLLTRDAYEFLNNLYLRVGGSLSSLNAASLQDATWDSPNPIGSTIPNTGQFTSLKGQTLTVTGAFGCNGKTPQTSATAHAAVVATAATNVSPYGFATAAQANDIVTLLNQIRAALVANGIMI